ncbi:ABC transporter permease [Clostridium butyricum]|jgi:NitT/TauT family transport system permease protein|uniref:ABC transporter permease n=1 Tax=Clostridium butyricum TaxID=1492 RepID=UPI0003D59F90|nr:MAG: Binding-protein-dependent transport system inner membrane component [Clostridium butyricum DORA_1]MDU1509941.1 ABC transporter permease [Clostridium butyricum]MDU4802294.1 ABC transporter permease [Clostridium butyricum]
MNNEKIGTICNELGSENISSSNLGFINKLKSIFIPKADISKKSYVILGITGFASVLIIWSLLTYTGVVDKLFLPTPTDTLKAALTMFSELGFFKDIMSTISIVMIGFVVSAIVAVPLGILIGTYKPFEAFFEPLLSFVRYLPASAFIPLFILWIGVNDIEKIAVIFMGSFFQLVLMVAVATSNVKQELIDVAYTLGTSKYSVTWRIILPYTLPSIVDSLRIILGWAWTYVIVAELVGASAGIGYTIIQAQRMLATKNIFVGILTIGIIGLCFDYCFKLLYKKLFPWN